MEAFTSLQKLQQQVPGVFPPGLLDAQARKLKRIQRRIEAIAFAKKARGAVRPQTEPQTAAPEAAGAVGFGSPLSGQIGSVQGVSRRANAVEKLDQKSRKLISTQRQLRMVASGVGDAFGRAFTKAIEGGKSFLDAMEQIVKSLLKKLTSLIIKLAVMSAFSTATGGAGGAAIGALGSLLGGAASGATQQGLSGMASGAVVKGPTAALVGEYPGAQSNPEIVSPESKMRDVFASTLRSEGAGGGMKLIVNVTGESRLEGRDIKQSYDTETRVRGRHGIE